MYADNKYSRFVYDNWYAFYGDEQHFQNSFTSLLMADDSATQADVQEWISAIGVTISVYSVAHYYDAPVDYAKQPEYHHYPCRDHLADPAGETWCSYCTALEGGFRNGRTVGSFVTFEQFNSRFPVTYHEDGEYRELPFRFDYTDLLTSASYYQVEEEEEEYDYDDESEEEYEDEDYDSGTGNYYGYNNADVVNPDHFAEVDNGWIAPNGTFYYVTDYNRHNEAHWECARILGFDGYDPVHSAEQACYIHVSRYYSATYRFHFIPDRPTRAQRETAALYASAMGIPLPDELVDHDELVVEENKAVAVYTYWTRVEDSVMPRALRDRFYPLSGD